MSSEEQERPDAAGSEANTLRPLAGEAGVPSVGRARPMRVPRMHMIALVALGLTVAGFTAVSIARSFGKSDETREHDKKTGEKPSTATADPRRLDLSVRPVAASAPVAHVIPAIMPLPEDRKAQPIPLRAEAPKASPEDAPVLLVSSRTSLTGGSVAAPKAGDPMDGTRRNLEMAQRQLQGVLDTMTTPRQAPSQETSAPSSGNLLGEFARSSTPRVNAAMLGDRSMVLPKGTAFTCALKTRIVSAVSGLVGCQVLRNVYGDDGRVLLIERGSHLDGEYRSASVRSGSVRIPILWTRVRTPNGVVVDLDSPATGPLGESGVEGHVENRWPERIGAALLLSLIDDSIRLAENHGGGDGGTTVVLPSTTSTTGKLAEKILDSTINIPPLIYQDQGAIVGIYVARDVNFGSVYGLKAGAR